MKAVPRGAAFFVGAGEGAGAGVGVGAGAGEGVGAGWRRAYPHAIHRS